MGHERWYNLLQGVIQVGKYLVYLEFVDGSIHELEIEAESEEEALDESMPKSLRVFDLEE